MLPFSFPINRIIFFGRELLLQLLLYYVQMWATVKFVLEITNSKGWFFYVYFWLCWVFIHAWAFQLQWVDQEPGAGTVSWKEEGREENAPFWPTYGTPRRPRRPGQARSGTGRPAGAGRGKSNFPPWLFPPKAKKKKKIQFNNKIEY